MGPTAQIARRETLAWPVTGSAMRTTGGGRKAAEVAASAATKGPIGAAATATMSAATEAGSLRSGLRTRASRRKLAEERGCWLTGLTFAC